MDGLIVCSIDSGMHVASEAYTDHFGFDESVGSDALQLASSLFGVYQVSRETLEYADGHEIVEYVSSLVHVSVPHLHDLLACSNEDQIYSSP
jgi:hypothetical protein